MSHNREEQQWVLLGASPASKQVWGLREINFPCGYMMPPGAFAHHGAALERTGPAEVWAMGGFAFELAHGGKAISETESGQYIAGYRPWVCVFHDALLDELDHRGHTIEMWDRGISIFHGLWRQSCQLLGDLIPVAEFSRLIDVVTTINHSGVVAKGVNADAYNKTASEIIHFMSQFMTVSAGDIWVQGPLVATRLPKDVNRFAFHAGDLILETMVDEWLEF